MPIEDEDNANTAKSPPGASSETEHGPLDPALLKELPTRPAINPVWLAELGLDDLDGVRKVVVVVEHPPYTVKHFARDVCSHLVAIGIGSLIGSLFTLMISYALEAKQQPTPPAVEIFFEE
jgi:hypothetical protein